MTHYEYYGVKFLLWKNRLYIVWKSCGKLEVQENYQLVILKISILSC